MRLQWIAVLLAATCFTSSSWAFFEVRGGLSVLNANPSEANDSLQASVAGAPKIEQMIGLTADVLVDPPLLPVGLGLRYEGLINKKGDPDSATGSLYGSFTRTSLLINKRLINTLIYLGPMLSIGFQNEAKTEFTVAGTVTKYKASSGFTAGIGAEAGVKLMFLRLGAELGYLYAPLGNLKDDATGNDATIGGKTPKLDLSGVYANVTLGFGF